jgi:hypothetical protein
MACRQRLATLEARLPSAGYARIITEGVALIARANETAPKLIDLCRSRFLLFDGVISTQISAAVWEQARQLKRARGFGSFQEVYLEGVLAPLVAGGLLTAGLDVKAADVEPIDAETARPRAA